MRIVFHLGPKGELRSALSTFAEQHQRIFDRNSITLASDEETTNLFAEIRLGQSDAVIRRLSKYLGVKTLIFSNEFFLSSPAETMKDGELFIEAEQKIFLLNQIFKDHHIEFLFEVRNLVSFFHQFTNETFIYEVRSTPVDSLKEASWYELLLGIIEVSGETKISVISTTAIPLNLNHILAEVLDCRECSTVSIEHLFPKFLNWRGKARYNKLIECKKLPSQNLEIYKNLIDKFSKDSNLYSMGTAFAFDADLVDFLIDSYADDLVLIGELEGVASFF
ncbi:hypothetical protein [Cochlodiniinecator piscidefendens]|uniref:hypothetical protein n=1 Tax=Cochlodiniinecator piscidefendens TaxID=2715756 RepID=UPI00140789D2|nr:hypothetical protein [Cochlodiniinecator piscidefendens]